MDSIGDIAPCPRQSDWGDGAYVDDAAKKCTVQTGRERQPLRAKVEKLPGVFSGFSPNWHDLEGWENTSLSMGLNGWPKNFQNSSLKIISDKFPAGIKHGSMGLLFGRLSF